MEDFKEFDVYVENNELRRIKVTNINSSGTLRKGNIYIFRSPNLNNEKTSNL